MQNNVLLEKSTNVADTSPYCLSLKPWVKVSAPLHLYSQDTRLTKQSIIMSSCPHHQVSNLYLLAVSRTNVNCAAVLIFLHRLVEVFKHYFQVKPYVTSWMNRLQAQGSVKHGCLVKQNSPLKNILIHVTHWAASGTAIIHQQSGAHGDTTQFKPCNTIQLGFVVRWLHHQFLL